jgi:hypothetical protein
MFFILSLILFSLSMASTPETMHVSIHEHYFSSSPNETKTLKTNNPHDDSSALKSQLPLELSLIKKNIVFMAHHDDVKKNHGGMEILKYPSYEPDHWEFIHDQLTQIKTGYDLNQLVIYEPTQIHWDKLIPHLNGWKHIHIMGTPGTYPFWHAFYHHQLNNNALKFNTVTSFHFDVSKHPELSAIKPNLLNSLSMFSNLVHLHLSLLKNSNNAIDQDILTLELEHGLNEVTTLQSLNLSHNRIKNSGPLIRLIHHNKQLKKLDLSHNDMDQTNFELLCSSIDMTQISHFNIFKNDILKLNQETILNFFKKASALEVLITAQNHYDLTCLNALLESTSILPQLHSMDVGTMKIQDNKNYNSYQTMNFIHNLNGFKSLKQIHISNDGDWKTYLTNSLPSISLSSFFSSKPLKKITPIYENEYSSYTSGLDGAQIKLARHSTPLAHYFE